jgi:hypothetical protein
MTLILTETRNEYDMPSISGINRGLAPSAPNNFVRLLYPALTDGLLPTTSSRLDVDDQLHGVVIGGFEVKNRVGQNGSCGPKDGCMASSVRAWVGFV